MEPIYAQYVLDRWMGLLNKEREQLDSRPCWAKEWKDMTVRGRPMVEYIQ